jgi:hypothetical protein
MDAFEDPIDGMIAATSVPPAFNHSLVVPVELKVGRGACGGGEGSDQAFEPNTFCPANVPFSVKGLPTRYKSPGSPAVSNDDGDANSRARIRECSNVTQLNWARDGPAQVWLLQDRDPPHEVSVDAFDGGAWNERTIVASPEHGFQPGEIRSSVRYDKAGVEKLPV